MSLNARKMISKLRGETDTQTLVETGLRVGKNFRRNEGCIIDPSHCWLIDIGDDVVLAPNVHILAHDASMWNDTGYTRIAPVKIGSNVFIGAGTIIMPGVEIGRNCIIGAGSVVIKPIPENSVAAGNPARVIGKQSEYIQKHREFQSKKPCYGEEYTLRNPKLTTEMKAEMKEALLKSGFGYVE